MSPPSAAAQQGDAAFPDVAVSWTVVDNFRDDGFRFLMTFENRGEVPLPADGWTLYFNFLRSIHTAAGPVRIHHVNGDFWRLEPAEEFPSLMPGQRIVLPIGASHWSIKQVEAPAGLYFVTADGSVHPVTKVQVVPFTHEAQTMRGRTDHVHVPTPGSRYAENRALSVLPPTEVGPIVPTPVLIEARNGQWALDGSTTVRHEAGLEREAAYLADALEPLLAARPRVEVGGVQAGDISLRTDTMVGGAEAYHLRIDPSAGAEVVGGGPAGVFYGVQSLRALLPIDAHASSSQSLSLPAVRVEDSPRFDYRGMHLDVSRNFQPVEQVEKLLELMSFYKLNRFHFHLTDDEGWRVEIYGLPELTEVGGRRGHTEDELDHLVPSYGSGPDPDGPQGSGYYTRDVFVQLLRHAAERHIEVIPEIDVPGHARAAIRAMEARHHRLSAQGQPGPAAEFRLHDPLDESEYRSVQNWNDNVINVCLPSTYRFLETVVDDLVAMFAEAGAPLNTVHVGGDEVPGGAWERSPACEELIAATPGLADTDDLFDYFLRRLADILDARGLTLAGWEEVAVAEPVHVPGAGREPNPEFVERGFVPHAWNTIWGSGVEDIVYRLANEGYNVVMSNSSHLYFDLAYDKHPAEPGFYWAGFVDTRMVYEVVPFDIFKTARRTLMGVPISEDAFVDHARPTAEGRDNILGLQGQLWGETLVEPSRMEYMAFPRLIALAERAWAPQPEWARTEDRELREERLDAAWNEFANRLGQREMPRLDHLIGGVGYRLPVPGAVVEDGVLHANVTYPGVSIHYTTDGSVPTTRSSRYAEPVSVDGPIITVRAFDTRGRGGMPSRIVPPQGIPHE